MTLALLLLLGSVNDSYFSLAAVKNSVVSATSKANSQLQITFSHI